MSDTTASDSSRALRIQRAKIRARIKQRSSRILSLLGLRSSAQGKRVGIIHGSDGLMQLGSYQNNHCGARESKARAPRWPSASTSHPPTHWINRWRGERSTRGQAVLFRDTACLLRISTALKGGRSISSTEDRYSRERELR